MGVRVRVRVRVSELQCFDSVLVCFGYYGQCIYAQASWWVYRWLGRYFLGRGRGRGRGVVDDFPWERENGDFANLEDDD